MHIDNKLKKKKTYFFKIIKVFIWNIFKSNNIAKLILKHKY